MPSMTSLIPVARAEDLERQEKEKQEANSSQPRHIQGLSAHLRQRWTVAKEGKCELEERMLRCVRQRNGEYDPELLQQIKAQGGSEVYVRLTSVKCRAATSWLRDTLLGSGADKPWAIDPTPMPDMPEDILNELKAELAQKYMDHMKQTGMQPTEGELRQLAQNMKDEAQRDLKTESKQRVNRMETRMEDQLAEGGWGKALNEFIDDIVTFPFAVVKGPMKRKRRAFEWQNGQMVPTEKIKSEWERVDPFMLYWAPWASDINDGFVIERHKLTADDLQALIGVPGYNESAIRQVLHEFRAGILGEWLWTDTAQAEVEGKSTTHLQGSGDLIDALQLWDSIPGKILLEWGVPASEIKDPDMSYPCECWLIGNTVIRAVLNFDPLARKPYYVAAYESRPGSVAGNGVADLCRDSQMMVNATARALANNMGISSGPQVGVNASRIPAGEDITQLFPWKIWQFEASEYNDNTPPMQFFQPQSNANELMGVFEKFSDRADEDTMIPKYMSGGSTPGAGRTSSGLSMLISNAGKGIKQVIHNIDQRIIVPAIERLYHDNVRYSKDPDLIGDGNIVARGAGSLVVKEAEAIRRNEFLQIVLNSPMAQQIVGLDGAAELLRGSAKNLDTNADDIVPPNDQLSVMEQQGQVIAQLQQELQAAYAELGIDPGQGGGQGQGGQQMPVGGPELLPDGAPASGQDGNQFRNVATGRNG